MANIKKIILDWSEYSISAVVIVRRESDNYLLDATDGTFKATPSNKYNALTENATIPGRYELSENSVTWNDGKYTSIIYKYANPSYIPIGSGALFIKNDTEVILDDNISSTAKEATLLRGLGLMMENHVEDDIVRNGANLKTSSKFYLYDSKTNANTHDKATGLIGTYSVAVTYDGSNNVTLFKVVRDT